MYYITFRFAVYGDMGSTNARSLTRLQEDVAHNIYDAILHIGDFAYDLDFQNGRNGDLFMNQIQPIAAYVPYMTLPGNHENMYNFSHYKNRFTMPGGDGQGQFFSFDVGPVHMVFISTEFYYYMEWGFQQIVNQYRWLEQDLKEANKPVNRAERPWIILMGHRPFYCSNSDDPPHCTNMENMVRVGLPVSHKYSLEELLYKYHVDVAVTAHEHSYERMWPLYNNTVCNGSLSEPYTNPKAPVQLVTGSAGCNENTDPFIRHPWPYSAFQSDDYGYSRFQVNKTHIHWQQVSDEKEGAIIDKITIIKTQHQRFDCPSKDHH